MNQQRSTSPSPSSIPFAANSPQRPIPVAPPFVRFVPFVASSPRRSVASFTLIELLTVIAIIGLLAALLLPAIGGAIRKGKCGKAKAEVKSIEHALRSYYTEYGMFPKSDTVDWSYGSTSGINGGNNTNLMAILTAVETGSPIKNPKLIVFLEIPTKSLLNGNFVDPWQNQYEITFDANYDNTCTLPAGAPVTSVGNQTVAVWSRGPDKVATSPNVILSWQ